MVSNVSRIKLVSDVNGSRVLRPPPVTRNLAEPRAWQREMIAVYRAARRGLIPIEAASKFTYMARQNVATACDLDNRDVLQWIKHELEGTPALGPPGYALEEGVQ